MNRSFDKGDPAAGVYALADACLKLVVSLDRLSEIFVPPGKSSLEIDYGLISLARRLEELSKQLGRTQLALESIATRCGVNAESPAAGQQILGQPSDPPEASEYRQPYYRRRGKTRVNDPG